ncbi:hypothetical protein CMV_020813 [Castanea mollissima]|uniref:Uncharacterized protein n=1 Tax=Castanea mollissima TaxID=60419 RepID=A0A8J4QXE0_9ROSI|nr:hypothetical protein CMV_020813 [Castanea mollissima]
MVKDDLRCLIQYCKIDNEIMQIHGRDESHEDEVDEEESNKDEVDEEESDKDEVDEDDLCLCNVFFIEIHAQQLCNFDPFMDYL